MKLMQQNNVRKASAIFLIQPSATKQNPNTQLVSPVQTQTQGFKLGSKPSSKQTENLARSSAKNEMHSAS